MPTLDDERILRLLRPYLETGPAAAVAGLTPQRQQALVAALGQYLDLLVRWNERTNLTAIRQPEQMVQRHFGESLFAGMHLADRLPAEATLLDVGSGAGFPGLPIQLLQPSWRVTLAESQNKKAGFLREAVRVLELETEVWAGRVESMPVDRRFDVVAMRAVDSMEAALREAGVRGQRQVVVMATSGLAPSVVELLEGFRIAAPVMIPGSKDRLLFVANRG